VSDFSNKKDSIQGLADFVVLRRKEQNISLRKLAELSGLTFSWLSKIEKGRIKDLPKVTTAIQLAKALEVSLVELVHAAGVDLDTLLPDERKLRQLRREQKRGSV
jgi:transcriptional regulator with XRE-family HTH domain